MTRINRNCASSFSFVKRNLFLRFVDEQKCIFDSVCMRVEMWIPHFKRRESQMQMTSFERMHSLHDSLSPNSFQNRLCKSLSFDWKNVIFINDAILEKFWLLKRHNPWKLVKHHTVKQKFRLSSHSNYCWCGKFCGTYIAIWATFSIK